MTLPDVPPWKVFTEAIICEPFTGIDNVLWRLNLEDDSTIAASRKKISEVVQMASDIHEAQQRVVKQDQVITSLRVWSLIKLCVVNVLVLATTYIGLHQF